MFSIYRSEAAVTPLRETWEYADDAFRNAIVQATFLVNRQLYLDPHRQGESRGGGTRILFQDPLGVLFEIDEEQKVVRVLKTWAYRPGKRAAE